MPIEKRFVWGKRLKFTFYSKCQLKGIHSLESMWIPFSLDLGNPLLLTKFSKTKHDSQRVEDTSQTTSKYQSKWIPEKPCSITLKKVIQSNFNLKASLVYIIAY